MSVDPSDLEGRLSRSLDELAAVAPVSDPVDALAHQRSLPARHRERRSGWRSTRRLATAAAAVVVLIGAGAIVWAVSERGPETPADPVPTTTSSPFVVGHVPSGYVPVGVERAHQLPDFGSLTPRTNEPFTLYSSDGTPEGEGLVAISFTPGPGGDIAARGSTAVDRFEVDGNSATFESGDGWADLTIVRNVAVGIRVSAASDRTRGELLAIASVVRTPPEIDPPPVPELRESIEGLRAVGSVANEVSGAVGVSNSASPAGAYVAEFARPGSTTPVDARLMVRSVPGRAGDLAVVGGHPWQEPRRVGSSMVDGREVVLLDGGDGESSAVTVGSSGDLVVVSASELDFDEMATVATSVEPADDRAFRDPFEVVTEGAGPFVDRGAEEVARGEVDGIDWLLQTLPPTRGPSPTAPMEYVGAEGEEEVAAGIEADLGIDLCIRWGDLTRWCAWEEVFGGPHGPVYLARYHRDQQYAVTVIGLMEPPSAAASLRVTPVGDGRPGPVRTESLRPAPSGSGVFTVVEGDVMHTTCSPTAVAASPSSAIPTSDPLIEIFRVELLDDGGEVLACVG